MNKPFLLAVHILVAQQNRETVLTGASSIHVRIGRTEYEWNRRPDMKDVAFGLVGGAVGAFVWAAVVYVRVRIRNRTSRMDRLGSRRACGFLRSSR